MKEDQLTRLLDRERRRVRLLEKTVEIKTREAYLKSEESERALAYLDTVFQSIRDPLVITDENWQILRFNKAFGERSNYGAEDLLGKRIDEFIADADLSEDLAELSRSDRVLQMKCQDGSLTPVLLTATTVAIDGGAFHHVFSFKEISLRYRNDQKQESIRQALESEVKERTRDISLALAEAKAANKAKSFFLANMSHELRTPLNAITGLTSMVNGEDTKDQLLSFMGKIRSSANILLALVNDILDFSKIEAGEFALEDVPFALRDMLKQLEDIFGEQAKAKDLDFRVVADYKIVDKWLLADRHRLFQVLMNLISNALKFTHEGHVTLTISMDGEHNLKFEVTDSGIGIPQEALGELFKPFTQADISTSRRFGGTGLGLSICSEIVAMMGGGIVVESQVGRGSSFWFDVPFKSFVPQKGRDNPEDFVVLPNLDGLRVLLVEDNTMNQDVMKLMLGQMSVVPDIAGNGKVAVEKAAKKEYDVILMDFQMPVMDGLTATELIRSEPQSCNRKTRIVAMTANALEQERRRGMALGMDHFLSKPTTVNDVALALQHQDQGLGLASGLAAQPGPEAGLVAESGLAAQPGPEAGLESGLAAQPGPEAGLESGLAAQLGPEAGQVAVPEQSQSQSQESHESVQSWGPLLACPSATDAALESQVEPNRFGQVQASTVTESVIDMQAVATLKMLVSPEAPDFFREQVNGFFLAVDRDMAVMWQCNGAGDRDTIKSLAHRLRTSSGIVGAINVTKACAAIESCHQEGGAQFTDLIKDLHAAYLHAKEQLMNLLLVA